MKVPVRALFPASQMDDGVRITKGTHCNQQYERNGTGFLPTTPNTLAERIASVDRLTDAVAAAVNGGRAANSELVAAREEFNSLFGNYRDWVNQQNVALGNAIDINKLGLEASKPEAHRASRPTAPLMKEVSVVGPGCIQASCTTVTGSLVYTYFVAYGDTEPPLDAFRFVMNSTKSREKLSVQSGQRPWVCVLVTNSAGMSEYSAPMALPVV